MAGARADQIWLGRRVEIEDEDGIFIYRVAPAGELVGVISSARGSKNMTVVEPMSIEYAVPTGDLFSRMSLVNSKVPKAIQSRASRADDRLAN